MATADLSSLNGLIDAIQRNTQAEQTAIQELRNIYNAKGRGRNQTGESNSIRATQTRETRIREAQLKVIEDNIKAFHGLNEASIDSIAALRQNGRLSDAATQEFVNQLDTLSQQTSNLSEEQRDEIDGIRDLIRQNGIQEEHLERINDITSDQIRADLDALRIQEETNRIQGNNIGGLSSLGESISAAGANLGSFKTIIGLGSAALNRMFEMVENAGRTLGPNLTGLELEEFGDVVERLGISQTEYLQIVEQNRTALITATGQLEDFRDVGRNYIDNLEQQRDALYDITGSSTEASFLFAELSKTLNEQTIAVTMEELNAQLQGPDGLISNMSFLAKTEGKSIREMNAMVDSLMRSNEMRAVGLGMEEKERKLRVKNFFAFAEQTRAMGMSVEQTIEFQRAMASANKELSAKDYVDQIGQFISGASALGIEQEKLLAFRVASLKPLQKRSEEEIKLLSDVSTEVENRLADALGGVGSLTDQQAIAMNLTARTINERISPYMNSVGAAASVAGNEHKALSEETREVIKAYDPFKEGLVSGAAELKKHAETVSAIAGSEELAGGMAGLSAAAGVAKGVVNAASTLNEMFRRHADPSRGGFAASIGNKTKGLVGATVKGAGALGVFALAAGAATDAVTAIRTGESQSASFIENNFPNLWDKMIGMAGTDVEAAKSAWQYVTDAGSKLVDGVKNLNKDLEDAQKRRVDMDEAEARIRSRVERNDRWAGNLGGWAGFGNKSQEDIDEIVAEKMREMYPDYDKIQATRAAENDPEFQAQQNDALAHLNALNEGTITDPSGAVTGVNHLEKRIEAIVDNISSDGKITMQEEGHLKFLRSVQESVDNLGQLDDAKAQVERQNLDTQLKILEGIIRLNKSNEETRDRMAENRDKLADIIQSMLKQNDLTEEQAESLKAMQRKGTISFGNPKPFGR
jgi:hypothetical protein